MPTLARRASAFSLDQSSKRPAKLDSPASRNPRLHCSRDLSAAWHSGNLGNANSDVDGVRDAVRSHHSDAAVEGVLLVAVDGELRFEHLARDLPGGIIVG